jgi:hypothetical protein
MLESISVSNYRSFSERSTVKLRPITILLGRNSAGKSSITRLFPLLQQSMERNTAAPILWSSPTVDFGRITDVISRAAPHSALELSFKLTDQPLHGRSWRWQMMYNQSDIPKLLNADVSFSAFLGAGTGGKTEYQRFTLQIDRDIITVDATGVTPILMLNNKKINIRPSWGKFVFSGQRLFPYVGFVPHQKPDPFSEGPDTSQDLDNITASFLPVTAVASERARRNSQTAINGATLPFIPRRNLIAYLRSRPNFVEERADDKSLDKLFELLLVTHITSLVENVGGAITPALTTLSYLGPIRARGDRFYRERELSVDKIDDKGENLATYIGSLNKSDLDSFNKILFTAFGVEVRPHPVEGHISIDIGRPGDEYFDNIADVGFGFSQLLPLVAQIHADSRRSESGIRFGGGDKISITAVEQPELHLHPAYQANIADLVVASVRASKARDSTPIIILETHSEALIGRLGELVALGQIDKNDIAVHFVEKSDNLGTSAIRPASFDDDGMIVNWPVGFFSARSI